MKRTAILAAVLLGTASMAAWAGTLTEVTSLAALGAVDSVSWAQLGPNDTALTTPEGWTSVLGATGEVGITGSTIGTQNMQRRDEGTGWGGDFTLGDALLWNQGAFGDSNIDFGILFNSPTYGGGLQLQPDYYGAFTATITAYDSIGDVLGVFTENGNSTTAQDGSATFLGVTDTAQEISFLDFSVTSAGGGGDTMAIDTLFLPAQATPEPASLLLIGSGLLGCGLLARRRRS